MSDSICAKSDITLFSEVGLLKTCSTFAQTQNCNATNLSFQSVPMLMSRKCSGRATRTSQQLVSSLSSASAAAIFTDVRPRQDTAAHPHLILYMPR